MNRAVELARPATEDSGFLKSYKYRLRVLPKIQFPNWLKASKSTSNL
jgi:hypothetical protein